MGFRFWSKLPDADFSQKYAFSFQFFNRILAKSRRTAERPTVHLKIYEYYDSPNIKTNDTLS